jgi:hypothetical protein
MRLYTYWTRESGTLRIEGKSETVFCYGGSNASIEDAKRKAAERIAAIQRKIDGNPGEFEEYQAEIREEIIERLDGRNIVTRNRYGALVLNSENVLFIDVDEPRLGFWESLFRPPRGIAAKKQRILRFIEEKARSPKYGNLGFRVYETSKGYRLLVTGSEFDPGKPDSTKILRDFNSDCLYVTLCKKQACFRARLTPKPYRIHCRKHKVVFPRIPEQDRELADWLKEYEEKSGGHATCKYIRTFGNLAGNKAIIEYHDRLTRASEALPLG